MKKPQTTPDPYAELGRAMTAATLQLVRNEVVSLLDARIASLMPGFSPQAALPAPVKRGGPPKPAELPEASDGPTKREHGVTRYWANMPAKQRAAKQAAIQAKRRATMARRNAASAACSGDRVSAVEASSILNVHRASVTLVMSEYGYHPVPVKPNSGKAHNSYQLADVERVRDARNGVSA